ncbi:MAG: deoxyribose-phosphate aldolase, partial [Bryobacteraceae bacterium]
MSDYTYPEIAKMIDHSLLQPYLSSQELERGLRIALAYDVATVCILPYYLRRCTELLAGSTVLPTTTVGFPHGGHATATKVVEARQALDEGARELDMVVNISAV